MNYTIPVNEMLKIVPSAGPSLQYGLKSKASARGETVDMYDSFMEEDIEYKKLQLFIGGGVAFDLADIVRFHIGYDLGLLKRVDVDGMVLKDTGRLNVGVSYLF